jgi:hypothetical protein
MTTDLDGKPMLMLKEADVRSLLQNQPSPELIARMDKWLAEAEKLEPQPTFSDLVKRQAGWDALSRIAGTKIV